MNKSQEDFTEKTRFIWSKYYKRDVSSIEAEEIEQNMKKLIELLETLNKN